MPLLTNKGVRRAVLLMGPRRVGKTVLIHHAIKQLIRDGVPAKCIAYVSVDNPIYNECGLQQLVDFCSEASGTNLESESSYVFFDEIQYLRDWERHLKSLVDSHKMVRFTASGSAAAALKLKSQESGAGRFTEFLLPPLTFNEYLNLVGRGELATVNTDEYAVTNDIDGLNKEFLNYLNYGGYPEAALSKVIQADPSRFIKNDIVDKVLLRDLPSLYGIQDIQELNYLFTTLAFNTAGEVSLEELSKKSGVAKNTIKKYIEYLEAAFLIKVVHRMDRAGKRFQRANYFKVYLSNPSIRGALFSLVDQEDEAMGHLTETAIFSQWFHNSEQPMYARWSGGEVDLVWRDKGNRKIGWAVEVKWSDRFYENPGELKSLLEFAKTNKLKDVTVTTRTITGHRKVDGIDIEFIPSSVYCYTLGHNILFGRKMQSSLWRNAAESKDKQIGLQL